MVGEPAPAKILIVEDHPMVREAIAMRLAREPDLEVCGEASSEQEALELLRWAEPDLMIVDILLDRGNGIDLIKQAKSRRPDTKILVCTVFQESLYAERALRAGALGYFNKQEPCDKLLDAVRTVLSGERYISADLARRLVGQALGKGEPGDEPAERLSDRELEVFRMIGAGMTTRVIAGKLQLSPHTIDSHRENIKKKLGAANAAELTIQAVQWVLENG